MSMSSSSSSLAFAPVPSLGIWRSNSSPWLRLRASSACFPPVPQQQLPVLVLQRGLGRSSKGSRLGFLEILARINKLGSSETILPLSFRGRHFFFPEKCYKAFNELTSSEYRVSCVYHAMSFFFEKFALMDFFKFFRESERRQLENVEKLFTYQHRRSGEAKVRPRVLPLTELYQADRGVPLKSIGEVDI